MRSVAQPSPAPTPPAKMNTLPILAKKLLKKTKNQTTLPQCPVSNENQSSSHIPANDCRPTGSQKQEPQNPEPRIHDPRPRNNYQATHNNTPHPQSRQPRRQTRRPQTYPAPKLISP